MSQPLIEYETPAETPKVEDGETTDINTGCDWTRYAALTVFDIRNGSIEDVVSLLIRPSVPAAFHWVPIASLAARDGMTAMDGFIKSHIHHLNVTTGNTYTADLRRKMGIVLGAMRAVATTYYRLDHTLLIPGEVATPYLVARMHKDGNITYNLNTNVTTSAILSEQLKLSHAEKSVISVMISCGIGALPMQGYSLIMTGHHYLSEGNNQSRKCFDVAERAYWSGNAVKDWFDADMAALQDAAWHKALHPVQISIKTEIAMDEDISKKLKVANAGACASRLPAAEAELRAANSYLTCIRTVTQLLKSMKVPCDYTPLVDAIAAVKCFNVNGGGVLRDDLLHLPTYINSRGAALEYLEAVTARAQNVAAFCFGFYCTMLDAGTTSTGSDDGQSLKNSNSLMKLRNDCVPTYTAGCAFYGDYVAVRNAQRQKGSFMIPDLTFD